MVKELREQTGAPMLECKTFFLKATAATEKAIEVLRTKGLSAAASKAGRSTGEGLVGHYIHAGGRIGVLVEINCETDFVARTDDFQALVKNVAMHVAAADPKFVTRDEISEEVIEKERRIFRQQALETGKPENVIDRIVEGKMEKFYGESVLLEQPFVKDSDVTVGDLVNQAIATIRENIRISRFTRYKLGE